MGMKNLKLVLFSLVLFMGVGALVFSSCSKKTPADELQTSSTAAASIISQGPSCDAECLFSDCKTTCNPGQDAHCECSWGFAHCSCSAPGGNKLTRFDVESVEAFQLELKANKVADVTVLKIDNIIADVSKQDWAQYNADVIALGTDLNSLPVETQEILQNWLNIH